MSEGFRPITHTPPNSIGGKVKFYGRMVFDLQILTIYRDIKKIIPAFRGSVLDVGCGQSPYRHLLDVAHTKYFGIDIADADEQFGYRNPDVTSFAGCHIPFEDAKFDGLICTEVLEHVQNFQGLVDEVHRVMKDDAVGIVTVPWSARYHYIPNDYFRYTPSSLSKIFERFRDVKIANRGTDIANIANKVIVLWYRNLFPESKWRWFFVPFWIALSPILLGVVLLAHLSLVFDWGSKDDPLGYTIVIKK
jgi:SAM-dependent methyltransferase